MLVHFFSLNMVSIVEVEIFGFFAILKLKYVDYVELFSKWPVFYQNGQN